jgi:hypothetical protein
MTRGKGYSVAVINGFEYKYRWLPGQKKMEYLGPVGDAPSLTQEQFKEAIKKSKVETLASIATKELPDWKVTLATDFVIFHPMKKNIQGLPEIDAHFPSKDHTGQIEMGQGRIENEEALEQLKKALTRAAWMVRGAREQEDISDPNWKGPKRASHKGKITNPNLSSVEDIGEVKRDG